MSSGTSRLYGLGLGLVAMACANEPPTTTAGELPKLSAIVTVDRSEPASADTQGSASAIARFISVPAFSDANRALVATGAALELPAADTCVVGDQQEEAEALLPGQGPVELVEAGDVTIAADGLVTPLVPHAFPTVAGLVSGVLYTTRDRASSALPSGTAYVVSTTGSGAAPAVRAEADAPHVPAELRLGGLPLKDVTELHTERATDLTWTPGESGDVVYAELFAYDGSSSVVCTFRDDTGTGTIPAEVIPGTGAGRVALHRVRTRRVETTGAPAVELRFDFQVGAPVEFVR